MAADDRPQVVHAQPVPPDTLTSCCGLDPFTQLSIRDGYTRHSHKVTCNRASPSADREQAGAGGAETVKDGQKIPDRNHALNVIAGELSSLYGWLLFTTRYSAAHEALAVVERRLGLPVGQDPFPSSTNGRPPAPSEAERLERAARAAHKAFKDDQLGGLRLWKAIASAAIKAYQGGESAG